MRRWWVSSAGQAAPHFAKFAARVTLLAWGEPLAASMSGYLITQRKATPNIEVRLRTRVADGPGQARLKALTLQDVRTGQREQVPAAAVFVIIGAEPRTQWLRDLVMPNDRGSILTGRDVPPSPSFRAFLITCCVCPGGGLFCGGWRV